MNACSIKAVSTLHRAFTQPANKNERSGDLCDLRVSVGGGCGEET